MCQFCAPEMPVFLVPADYPQHEPESQVPSLSESPDIGREMGGSVLVGDGFGGVKETTIGELFPDRFGQGQVMPEAKVESKESGIDEPKIYYLGKSRVSEYCVVGYQTMRLLSYVRRKFDAR